MKSFNRSFEYHQLEPRQLLASIYQSSDTLYLLGTEGKDHVKIMYQSTNPDSYRITHSVDGGQTQTDVRLGGRDIKKIVFMGRGGNDHFVEEYKLINRERVLAFGHEGDDILVIHSDGRVVGGPGNDTIRAKSGSNRLEGGDGIDTIVGGDLADLILGGPGDDVLEGNWGDDLIFGEEGNDHIQGDQGASQTSRGNDILIGGEGNDYIHANLNKVTPNGILQDNPELILGGPGADTLIGGQRNFLGNLEEGYFRIYGGDGIDTITGGSLGKNWLFGQDGDDVIQGGNGMDYISGGLGNDYIAGLGEKDDLFGGPGDDWIYGGNGPDWIYGEGGNDALIGGVNDVDFLLSGDGADRILGINADQVVNLSAADALIRFQNGRANWSDEKLVQIDEAFKLLHEYKANTRLLKDSISSRPIKFVLQPADRLAYEGAHWRRANQSYIEINEGTSGELLTRTVLHEIAHGWDEFYEFNVAINNSNYLSNFINVSPPGHPGEPSWLSIDDGDPQYLPSTDKSGKYWYHFATPVSEVYALTSPKEDWAVHWSYFFLYGKGTGTPLAAKLQIINQAIDAISR